MINVHFVNIHLRCANVNLVVQGENMTDNKKLFCVTLSGHYSMFYSWDDGWNIGSVYYCTMDGNIARFTVRDCDYDCKIDNDFVVRWGGYVDCLRDNTGSRSADVYVWANDVDDAKIKAHDVIMSFWPPTAYYKEVTAWTNF